MEPWMMALVISVPVLVLLIIITFIIGYVRATPDEAKVISGIHKEPRTIIGRAGFRWPFFERVDSLNLKLISVDVKTSSAVPTADYININVDSVVNIQVSKDPKIILLAERNFLNKPTDYIAKVAQEVLEGNMREIVGKMTLEEMVSDRQKFAELVKENAGPDLAAMGLDIISFNVQNFIDENRVIENLGVDNIVKIQKKAAISKAESERDIAQAQALSKTDIAKAEAAKDLEIAKIRAETEALVAKSEAEKAARQNEADGLMALAKATKAKGEAEAAAIHAKLKAEAEGTKQKLLAEAEGIEKKAEAQAKMGQASITEMQLDALKVYFNQLPAMAAAMSKPLENIDSITMYGEGDVSKFMSGVTSTFKQITDSMNAVGGVNINTILSSFLGNKLAGGNTDNAVDATALTALASKVFVNTAPSTKKSE